MEAERAGAAGVVETLNIGASENRGEERIQAVGVRGRASFVVVERGRFVFFEAALDPVDGAGVAIEADAHGEGDAEDAARLLSRRQTCLRKSAGGALEAISFRLRAVVEED